MAPYDGTQQWHHVPLQWHPGATSNPPRSVALPPILEVRTPIAIAIWGKIVWTKVIYLSRVNMLEHSSLWGKCHILTLQRGLRWKSTKCPPSTAIWPSPGARQGRAGRGRAGRAGWAGRGACICTSLRVHRGKQTCPTQPVSLTNKSLLPGFTVNKDCQRIKQSNVTPKQSNIVTMKIHHWEKASWLNQLDHSLWYLVSQPQWTWG